MLTNTQNDCRHATWMTDGRGTHTLVVGGRTQADMCVHGRTMCDAVCG